MNESLRFGLRVAAGALLVGAAGFAADAILGIDGYWVWGACAGAIGGALLAYSDEPVEEPGWADKR